MNYTPLRHLFTQSISSPARLFSSSTERSTRTSAATWIFFGTPIALTFSLGVWQVKRLSRKKKLIQDRHARLNASPLSASELAISTDTDFRRVHVRGRFLHDCEMFVSPRSAPPNLPQAILQWGGSSGLQVITPCVLDNNTTILVNRGWIPHRLTDGAKRESVAVSPLTFLSDSSDIETQSYTSGSSGNDDHVEFTAVVRTAQERNRFVPANVPEKNEWFYIDPETMLLSAGCRRGGENPIVVELYEPLPTSGWPFPRSYEQFLEFRTPPSTHVTYATTWFSLSAALAVLTRFRMRRIPHSKS